MRSFLAGTFTVGVLTWLMPAAPAVAAAACSFDEVTATVHVTIPGRETAVLARSGDAILLDGVMCETASVLNTDLVLFVDDQVGTPGKPNVTIDLSGGPMAPGLTAEDDGSSEIEIWHAISDFPGAGTLRIVGTAGDDRVEVMIGLSEGESGAWFDLNTGSGVDGEGDIDIRLFERFEFDLGEGDDRIGMGDVDGFGPPMEVIGGPGDDVLPDGVHGDSISGGSGRDLLVIYFGDVHLDLTEPTFESGGEPGQPISGIEDVRVLTGQNVIEGTAGPNLLIGGPATDFIFGRGGNDVIRGGGGDDHITGMGGNDMLVGGSGPDDLVGGSGADDLTGGDGPDNLWGSDGGDQLSGGNGDDVLRGGLGNDSCSGGPGDDTVTGCDP
jgi:Ca2+-binding RTX toxin-like protein